MKSVFFQKVINYLAVCPLWMARFYIGLFPKPDIIFFLEIDPHSAMQRKNEDSLAALARQDEAYNRIMPFLRRCTVINGKDSQELVHRHLTDNILNVLN